MPRATWCSRRSPIRRISPNGGVRLHQPGLRDRPARRRRAAHRHARTCRNHLRVIYKLTGVVREIVPPERLVFTVALHEDDGSIRLENETSVTFAEHARRTTITLHVSVIKATAAAKANSAEWTRAGVESIDRLADHVAHIATSNI